MWRDISAVKSNGCFYRETRLKSQHSSGSLQLSVNTVEDLYCPLLPSAGTRQAHDVQTKHLHTYIFLKLTLSKIFHAFK